MKGCAEGERREGDERTGGRKGARCEGACAGPFPGDRLRDPSRGREEKEEGEERR